MTAVMIRAARLQDAGDIAALCTELGYATSAAQMHSRLALLCNDNAHWVGVAEQLGARLLGWIHVARIFSLEAGEAAEILGLVVGAAARRRGIGKQLVETAQAWSGRLGLARIKVRSSTVRVDSHEFYPALGFARTKSQHVYDKPLSTDASV